MSFWENNKGTFKAAGRSVANGTKAVGKAGVRTYKKNEAKRNGVEYNDPYPQESKSGETYIPYQAKALPSKEKLLSYQPPPKRNVGVHSIPKRGESAQYVNPTVTSTVSAPPTPVTQPQYQQPQAQQPVQSQPQQEELPLYQVQPLAEPQAQVQHPAPAQPQIPTYNQNVQDTPHQPLPQVQIQPVQPPQLVAPPQLPLRSAVPPSLPSRNSSATIPQQSSTVTPVVTQQPDVAPVKPKPVLRDPTSFAPPPRRVDLPPLRSSRHGSQNSVPLVSSAAATQQDASFGAPVAPITTTDSESSTPIKKKPPKPKKLQVDQPLQQQTQTAQGQGQQFNLNAFPNPRMPQTPETEEQEEEDYTNPPKPPRPQNENRTLPPMPVRRTTNEDIAPPPMPARHNMNESTPPPMPSRNQADAVAAVSQKKAPPPKPLKKPSTLDSSPPPYSNNPASNSQGDVLNELNSIFQRMNMNKNSDNLVHQLEPKEKPEVVIKPKVKPEIAAKPKINPEITAKPVIETKSERSKPPVPVHRERTPQKSPTPPPVPPSRNYSRAPAPVPVPTPVISKPSGPPQLDLELHTGWFAKRDGPLQLPKDLEGLNYKTTFLTGMGIGGKQTFNITARLKDLSIITYKFEYSSGNINDVNVVIGNFVPSPLEKIPTKEELVANHERFGEYVAGWCEHHKGKTVGRGECWDLAKEALQKGCGNHAFVSTYVIHGYPILQVANSGSGIHFINSNQQLDDIRRGDILQFKTCTFFDPATGVTGTCGQPDHTAIVVRKEGDKLILLEQNLGGRRYVVDGECIIKNLTQGEMYVFRPMPKEWAGEL